MVGSIQQGNPKETHQDPGHLEQWTRYSQVGCQDLLPQFYEGQRDPMAGRWGDHGLTWMVLHWDQCRSVDPYHWVSWQAEEQTWVWTATTVEANHKRAGAGRLRIGGAAESIGGSTHGLQSRKGFEVICFECDCIFRSQVFMLLSVALSPSFHKFSYRSAALAPLLHPMVSMLLWKLHFVSSVKVFTLAPRK